MSLDRREHLSKNVSESKKLFERTSHTTFLVPQSRELHLSASAKSPAATKPALESKSEPAVLNPVRKLVSPLLPTGNSDSAFNLQDADAWNDPNDLRNIEVKGGLKRIGRAMTDFVGQYFFWTLAPTFIGIRNARKSENIFVQGASVVAGLAGTGLLYFYAGGYITVIGLGTAVYRLFTGKSHMPRFRDYIEKGLKGAPAHSKV